MSQMACRRLISSLPTASAHDLDYGRSHARRCAGRKSAGVLVPEGELTEPVAIIPWPNASDDSGPIGPAPTALVPAADALAEERLALADVAALAKRLFPNDHTAFALKPVAGARDFVLQPRHGAGRSRLRELGFSAESVSLSYAGPNGAHLRTDHSGADGCGARMRSTGKLCLSASPAPLPTRRAMAGAAVISMCRGRSIRDRGGDAFRRYPGLEQDERAALAFER